MKKISITLAFVAAFATVGYTQKKSKSVVQDTHFSTPSVHLAVYQKASVYGDASTAIASLNYLLVEDPTKYSSYADTLALVYQNTGNYVQCTNLVNELLKKDPEKESLLAMKAFSMKQLGMSTESADLYNRLYTKTKQYGYGLELVQLQLGLQRLAECVVTANRLVAQEISAEAKISVPKVDNKSTQSIGVKAFVFYIEGLAHNLAKDTEKAKKAIQKAVELETGFELATNALTALQKQVEAPKESGSATNEK